MRKVETKQKNLNRFAFDPSRDRIVDRFPKYINHPFFVEKAEQVKKELEIADFSKELLRIKAERINK